MGIGTFDTALEAAVAAALAEKSVKAGMAVYSPEKPQLPRAAQKSLARGEDAVDALRSRCLRFNLEAEERLEVRLPCFIRLLHYLDV